MIHQYQKKLKLKLNTHVSSHVVVLGVTTSGNGSGGSDTAVDGVDGPEHIGVLQEVGQGLVRAGLESCRVTSSSGIESVDRSQNGVCI